MLASTSNVMEISWLAVWCDVQRDVIGVLACGPSADGGSWMSLAKSFPYPSS